MMFKRLMCKQSPAIQQGLLIQNNVRSQKLVRQFTSLVHKNNSSVAHMNERHFKLQDVDRSKFERSKQLPDFNGVLPGDESVFQRSIKVTAEMAKEKHPLEYSFSEQRLRADPYIRMNDSSLLITNFPGETNVNKQFILDMVYQQEPDAIINRVDVYEAEVAGHTTSEYKGKINRTAYAIVDFEFDDQLRSVRRGLRQTWMEDKLIKVKTLKDREHESHDARTVVLENLPANFEAAELLDRFGGFGAVTSFELPAIDQYIESKLDLQARSDFGKHYQTKKDKNFRLSKQLVAEQNGAIARETQAAEGELEQVLAQQYGAERAAEIMKEQTKLNQDQSSEAFTKFNVMDSEKFSAFVRVLSQLQSEVKQIEQGKASVASVIEKINTCTSSGSTAESLDLSADQIKKVISYLQKNQDSMVNEQAAQLGEQRAGLEDPSHALQRMALGELTHSYDFLLELLRGREKLIQRRIAEAIEFHGNEERILYEEKDFAKENEDMPNLIECIYRGGQTFIEEYLSVNEQAQGVLQRRKIPGEVKLYQLMSGSAPYNQSRNFNETLLAFSKGTKFDSQRMQFFPRSDVSRTDLIMGRESIVQPYHRWAVEKIKEHAAKVQADQDAPYDEIYHKERQLVLDIVRLEKAIKAARARQLNPGSATFDPEELREAVANDPDATGIYGEDLYADQTQDLTQFQADQRRKQRRVQAGITPDSDGNMKPFNYQSVEKQTIEELIQSGQLNRTEYEVGKARRRDNMKANLGYAMVTFSHADEARQAVIITGGKLAIDGKLVEVKNKGNLDHRDLDKSYKYKKLRNEGELADMTSELREARAKLRQFERDMDADLPQKKRLNEFRKIALEMLENDPNKTRLHRSGSRRTKRERLEMEVRIKALQKANPHMDLAQLLENEETELVRKEQHKRAFENFKDYEFLKAGLLTSEQKKTRQADINKGAAREGDVFEPYNYPPVRSSVAAMVTDKIQPRVNLTGNALSQRGRRFEYNDQDFLESYLGKDFAAKLSINDTEKDYNHNMHAFDYQESLKEMFPDKSVFLKKPKVLEAQRRHDEYFGQKAIDGDYADPSLGLAIEMLDPAEFQEKLFEEADLPHPSDPKRSYLKDLNQKIADYRKRLEAAGHDPNELFTGDVNKILREITQEYDHPYSQENLSQTKLEEYIQERFDKDKEFSETLLESLDENPTEDNEVNELVRQHHRGMFMERFKRHENYYKKHVDGDLEALADRFLAEKFGSSKLQAQEGEEDAIDHEEVEGEFEQGSMFQPHFENSEDNHDNSTEGSTSGGQSQVQQSTQDGGVVNPDYNMGSPNRYRRFNEGLYSLKHAEKNEMVQHLPPLMVKQYQKVAKDITKMRRDEFIKIRDEERAKPKHERTPYQLDERGRLVPYDKELVQRNRAAMKLPIPETEPTYDEFKQGITQEQKAAKLAQNQAEEVDPIEAAARAKMTEKARSDPFLRQYDGTPESMPAPLPDILNLEPDEAIPDMQISEVLENVLKHQLDIDNLISGYTRGPISQYSSTYMDEKDLAQHNYRASQHGGRTLKQFAEQDERDIYDKYRSQEVDTAEQLRIDAMDAQQSARERQELYERADRQRPKLPTSMSDYLEREAKGKSMFDDFSTGMDEERRLAAREVARIQEEANEEKEREREMWARLHAGKLKSSQLDELMGTERDEFKQQEFDEKNASWTRLEMQDTIRNAEEVLESYRLRKVLSGEWPEEQSREILKAELRGLEEQFPTPKRAEAEVERIKQSIANEHSLRNSQSKKEREYYFDEGLGQSLKEHMEQLKNQFPDVNVETRRDRDGYAIVKLSHKPTYKYDLDALLAAEPAELRKTQLQVQEAMTSLFMPEDTQQFVATVGAAHKGASMGIYLDQDSYDKLNELVSERYFGKFKDDHAGFVQECRTLKMKAATGKKGGVQLDLTELLASPFSGDGVRAMRDAAHDALLAEKDVIDREISEQLELRMRDKLHFSKLEKSDFVRASRSESALFTSQVGALEASTQIMERESDWLLQNAGEGKQFAENDDFNRDKFNAMKAEIRRRKEAKQRILQQGFADTKYSQFA